MSEEIKKESVPPEPAYQISYIEQPIEKVMDYYMRGFRPPPGLEVVESKWFLDPMNGVVILKLFVKPSPVIVLKE